MGLLGGILNIGASLIGGSSQKKAADNAAKAQVEMAREGMGALNRQFDWAKSASSPWTTGGSGAQAELMRLLGMGDSTDWEAYVKSDPEALKDYLVNWSGAPGSQGNMSLSDYGRFHYTNDLQYRRGLRPDAQGGFFAGADPNYGGRDLSQFQSDPIAELKSSPVYQALFKNGVDATLANASATGGLRGGNAQDALARVGTDTLAKVYNDRIGQLSGVSNTGLQAVTGLEGLGAENAAAIAALFGKQGEARAGASLAKGAINASMAKNVAQGISDMASAIPGIGGLF